MINIFVCIVKQEMHHGVNITKVGMPAEVVQDDLIHICP